MTTIAQEDRAIGLDGKSKINTYLTSQMNYERRQKASVRLTRCVAKKNPMDRRHIERWWVEIVVATERVLQRMFYRDGSLIPIPVRAIVDRRRPDRRRSGA